MSQILLVRNVHAGIEQAEKLEPYIERADAVSPETAFVGGRFVATIERAFNPSRKSNLERKVVDDGFNKMHLDDENDDSVSYQLRLNELITGCRKPIFIVEYYSDDELSQLSDMNDANQLYKESRDLFSAGKVDQSIDKMIRKFETERALAEHRNARIVRNAGPTIKRAKTSLRKNDITFLVIIGAYHDIGAELAKGTGYQVSDIYLPAAKYYHLLPVHACRQALAQRSENLRDNILRNIFMRTIASYLSITPSVMKFATYKLLQHVGGFMRSPGYYLNKYVVEPLACSIAGQLSPDDMRAYSVELGMQPGIGIDPERGPAHLIGFLQKRGLPVALDMSESNCWNNIFPSDQEKPTEPIVRVYNP